MEVRSFQLRKIKFEPALRGQHEPIRATNISLGLADSAPEYAQYQLAALGEFNRPVLNGKHCAKMSAS